MKKTLLPLLGLIALSACSQSGNTSESSGFLSGETPKAPSSESNVLIAYFSATRHTEAIASYVQKATSGDLFEIVPTIPYTDADLNYSDSSCRANREQANKSFRPEIASSLVGLEDYDTVFLGYGIWWGEEPRIIDAFIESYDFSGKRVVPFCTSGSSGISSSVANIKALISGNDITVEEGRRFAIGENEENVSNWAISYIKGDSANINLNLNEKDLTIELEDNVATKAILKQLENGPISFEVHDYGGFEKTGESGYDFPTSNIQMDVDVGDVVLYQGSAICFYYAPNSWSFTKIGHIIGLTNQEIVEILKENDTAIATLSI